MGNLGTMELTGDARMVINDGLYQEFRDRYGTIAAELVIFYTQLRKEGDSYVRLLYPQATYYRYRQILVEGGYLSLNEFKSATGRKPYSYKRG